MGSLPLPPTALEYLSSSSPVWMSYWCSVRPGSAPSYSILQYRLPTLASCSVTHPPAFLRLCIHLSIHSRIHSFILFSSSLLHSFRAPNPSRLGISFIHSFIPSVLASARLSNQVPHRAGACRERTAFSNSWASSRLSAPARFPMNEH